MRAGDSEDSANTGDSEWPVGAVWLHLQVRSPERPTLAPRLKVGIIRGHSDRRDEPVIRARAYAVGRLGGQSPRASRRKAPAGTRPERFLAASSGPVILHASR